MLSQSDIRVLTGFLADPARPDGTLTFQELQGFLFAVASSLELIPPSAWVPIISDEQSIGFQDKSEAQRIIGLIMELYYAINEGALNRSKKMPAGCKFRPNIGDNFDDEVAIAQWSRGFMIGHDWLTEVWDEYLSEERDGEFSSTSMVVSFFSSRRLAELYHLEATTTPKHRKPKTTFVEFAETVRGLFPDALSSYAHIGRSISEALAGLPSLDS